MRRCEMRRLETLILKPDGTIVNDGSIKIPNT